MRADDLLTLARAYSEALDIALSTAGMRACGNVYVFNRLAEGKGCHSKTLDKASAWFAENWPDGVPWPAGIPRPKCHTSAPKAA
jgi:hypothetical protein